MNNVELIKENNEYFIEWIKKEWKSHNEVDEFYQINLDSSVNFTDNEFYYKIIYKNEMVGFIGFKIKDDIKFNSHVLYLYRFYIDLEYRNLGIGTKVMEQIIQMAKDMNRDLELDCFGNNKAIDLYKRMGFKTNSVNMILKVN